MNDDGIQDVRLVNGEGDGVDLRVHLSADQDEAHLKMLEQHTRRMMVATLLSPWRFRPDTDDVSVIQLVDTALRVADRIMEVTKT